MNMLEYFIRCSEPDELRRFIEMQQDHRFMKAIEQFVKLVDAEKERES